MANIRQVTRSVIYLFILTTAVYLVRRNNDDALLVESQPLTECDSAGDKDFRTKDIDSMGSDELRDYVLWTNSSACKIVHDFGGDMQIWQERSGTIDGQKSVCMDPGLAPVSGSCLVYSFGIHWEWSFDDQFDQFGCQVFAFDPSMNASDYDRSPNVHFFNLGIGDEDTDDDYVTEWKLRTLQSIYDMLKPRHGNVPIDYLKMDIEQNEWLVIPQLIRSNVLDNVKQMGVEIHFYDGMPFVEFTRICLKILRSLEAHGFRRFTSRANTYSGGTLAGKFSYLAFELAWYNPNYRLDI